MARNGRKDFTPQAFKPDSALVERPDRYSRATGVAKTFAVGRAAGAYLDRVAPEEPGAADGGTGG